MQHRLVWDPPSVSCSQRNGTKLRKTNYKFQCKQQQHPRKEEERERFCWLRSDPRVKCSVCPGGQEQTGGHWYRNLMEKLHHQRGRASKWSWANLQLKMIQKRLTLNKSANGEELSTQTWETRGVNVLITIRITQRKSGKLTNMIFFSANFCSLTFAAFHLPWTERVFQSILAPLHCDYYTLTSRNLQKSKFLNSIFWNTYYFDSELVNSTFKIMTVCTDNTFSLTKLFFLLLTPFYIQEFSSSSIRLYLLQKLQFYNYLHHHWLSGHPRFM